MRNVLVTGGTRGVGLAVASRLAADGFRVFALGRKESEDLTKAIAAFPAGALNFVPFDLMQVDVIPDLVREMKAEHGPFYGLVNNAALGTEGLLSNMHNSDIEKLVQAEHGVADRPDQICGARHDDGGRGAHRQYQLHHRLDRL